MLQSPPPPIDAQRVLAVAGGQKGLIGGTQRILKPQVMAELEAARAWLGEPAPLALEIGFGDASFLCRAAAAHPEVRFLGLEVKHRLVTDGRARAAKAGLDNTKILEGDARALLPLLLGPGRLAQVWVLFPDPWWKDRHWKRRALLTPPFVELVRQLLEPGGVLTLKTDVPGLAGEACGALDGNEGFAPVDRDRLEPPPDATTKRERRCGHEGTPFSAHRWVRRS